MKKYQWKVNEMGKILKFVGRHDRLVTILGFSCPLFVSLISIVGLQRNWAYFINSAPNVGTFFMTAFGMAFVILASLVIIIFLWAIVRTLQVGEWEHEAIPME